MKEKTIKILFITLIAISFIGGSLGYFRPAIMGSGKHNFAVSANLEVTFNDVDTLTLKNNKPIYENDYKYKADYIDFSITGQNNTIEGCYTLYISVKEMTPNLKSEYFKWILYDLDKEQIYLEGDFSSYNNGDLKISNLMQLKRTTNDRYRLYIFLVNDEEENQTELLNSSFSATVKGVSNDVCPPTLTETMLAADVAISDANIDYSYTSDGSIRLVNSNNLNKEIKSNYLDGLYNKTNISFCGVPDDVGPTYEHNELQITNGLYYTEDATEGNERVYFYRGAVTNNYLVFGSYEEALTEIRGYYSETSLNYAVYNSLSECNNASSYNYNCEEVTLASAGSAMCWRIVRTVEDGSVRLRYGGPATQNGEIYTCPQTGTAVNIATERVYNEEEIGINYKNSSIRTVVENWYRDYLWENGQNTAITNLIADTPYCNDMSEITNGSTIYFGAYDRLITNKNPQYKCANTIYEYTMAKGDLTYPVGLLTADEVAYAGGVYGESLFNSFLYTSSSSYWTMSPSYFNSLNSSSATLFCHSVITEVISSYDGFTDINYNSKQNVVPVISLKPEARISSGTGLYNDPYIIYTN